MSALCSVRLGTTKPASSSPSCRVPAGVALRRERPITTARTSPDRGIADRIRLPLCCTYFPSSPHTAPSLKPHTSALVRHVSEAPCCCRQRPIPAARRTHPSQSLAGCRAQDVSAQVLQQLG